MLVKTGFSWGLGKRAGHRQGDSVPWSLRSMEKWDQEVWGWAGEMDPVQGGRKRDVLWQTLGVCP